MKRYYRTTLMVLAAALLAVGLGSPAYAAHHEGKHTVQRNVADQWMFWPRHGQGADLAAAIKKHIAWRKSAGDPFHWRVYQPVVGSDLGHFLVRSGNHAWTDMDSERDWGSKAGAGKHFREAAGDHIGKAEHYFGVTLDKYSHWIDDKGYRYFGVTTYRFKPGHGKNIAMVMKKIHKAVTDQKWPHSFSVDYTVGGAGGMNIVTPMKGYAGMAEPKPSMMDVMTKAMGSKAAAEKLMSTFSAAVKERRFMVYEYRADLSMPD